METRKMPKGNEIRVARGEGIGGDPFLIGSQIFRRKGDYVYEASGRITLEKDTYYTVTASWSEYYDEDGMSFGVGDNSGYVYLCLARPATDEESAPLIAKAAEREAQKAFRKHLDEAFNPQLGEYIKFEDGHQMVLEGESIPHPSGGFNIYGGGREFLLDQDDEYVWLLINNGMDGDDWSRNNVRTGGAGAIGYRFVLTQERRELIDALPRPTKPEPAVETKPVDDYDFSADGPGVWFVPDFVEWAVCDTAEMAQRVWSHPSANGTDPTKIKFYPNAKVLHASNSYYSTDGRSFCLLDTGDLMLGRFASFVSYREWPKSMTDDAERLISWAVDGNRPEWGKQSDGSRPWRDLLDVQSVETLTESKRTEGGGSSGSDSATRHLVATHEGGSKEDLWLVVRTYWYMGEDADVDQTAYLYHDQTEAQAKHKESF